MFTGIFNGEHICSLNMTDDEWKHVRKEARNHDAGKLTSPFSGEPMMCVQNSNGLRFFRMHKGCHDGMTEPETQHHIRLKYEAMKAAREIGLKADVEVPADDRRWIAFTGNHSMNLSVPVALHALMTSVSKASAT